MIYPFLVALFGTLAAGSIHAYNPPFEQPRSLAFIEDRGGLALTETYRKNNRWWLGVECNVSGIKTISETPRTLHSGLAWSKSVATVEDDRIYLTVFTAVQGPQAPSANCGDAPLARVERKVYPVYYVDPDEQTHLLGNVRFD